MPSLALGAPPLLDAAYNTHAPSLDYLDATVFAVDAGGLIDLRPVNQESFYNSKSFFIYIMASSGAAAVAIVLPVS